MRPEPCFRCGHPREELTRRCSNCHTEFWCRWNQSWYQGRLTRVSLGQDPAVRKLAAILVGAGSVFLAYGVVLQVYYANPGKRDVTPLLALFVGAWALFEVWAFFSGKATIIDHMVHEPRPENTWWRSLGLLGDLLFFGVACSMLYRLK